MQLSRRLAESLRGLFEASRERLAAIRPDPPGPRRSDLASLLGLPIEEADGEPEDEAAAQLRLAQATIDELRTALEQLQPLGEQLGEVEAARLDLLEELERARREPTPVGDEDELARLQKELAKRDRRIATLEERLGRMRSRYEERHRKASERWHELVELRKRVRELEQAARED
jgi:predicted  nucleic acid-binding Zn-ribbon protein